MTFVAAERAPRDAETTRGPNLLRAIGESYMVAAGIALH